jgi:hypothetical protein
MWHFTAWDDIGDGKRLSETLHVFDNEEQAMVVWEDLGQFHWCSPLTKVEGCEISTLLRDGKFYTYGRPYESS